MYLKAQLSFQKFSIVLMNLIEMKTPPAIYLHNIRWEQLQIRANMAEMGQLKSPRLKTWEILPFKKRKKTCFFTEHHWQVVSVPQLPTSKNVNPKKFTLKFLSQKPICSSKHLAQYFSTVSFQFKEVPFSFLKSKIFDLRKILCSKSKNGNQKKSLMQVNLQVENFLKSKIYCTITESTF